ncbi:Asp-tRNA(Asn)/Glu-tRNA(Gln) amidotransferase subunit GatA [Azonexus hydrophilus]|uniref:Asp-tRNA(Asn)/Glu-tRNA(Gln) amidotransferase subunit GatA n=1 Tax=Azonexus hydrophilus TaxID=418702 RepID=UPI0019627850|nr:Asp-tRNA(Asn)/Glu-tRNA(Gln) amidotransferase subunit GatA [Azonexus hydrophilus]
MSFSTPAFATLTELSQALAAKKVSSVELATHYLDRIERLNPSLNALITVDRAKTLAEAQAADTRLAAGNAGPLTGLPIAHKDLFCAEGWRTTCGSKMLENFVAPYDATVIRKLHAEAGMVCVGRANMDEFAMGSSNETSYFGPVKNPWDSSRVAGGSSGGSAAVVAAGLAPVATATDTGGSIRQPAGMCNLTGLKPSYGVVSRYGMVAYASSLDQGGIMAHTAEDCALMLNAMAGFDERDSTSLERAPEDYRRDLEQPLAGLRIGLPKEFFGPGCDPAVMASVQEAIKQYQALGATLVDVSLPHTDLAVPVYYVIASAEASSNLSRYDGVRFGYRAPSYDSLDDMYMKSRSQAFGEEVKRRILIGTYVLSHGYYDAYYLQAQRIRRLIANDFVAAFKSCDVILGPTAPTPAFRIGEKISDPVQMYLFDIYTISVNLAGLPGLSLPCGQAAGLPVGLQLIGNYFSEARLLNVAHRFQQATDWHRQHPTGLE